MAGHPAAARHDGRGVGIVNDAHRASLARTFKRDERLERMLALKVEAPDAWNRLTAIQHMTVGYYTNAKAAAMTTDPAA